MRVLRFLGLVILFGWAGIATGESIASVGVGMSSAYSGRYVPVFHSSLHLSSIAVSYHGANAETSVYKHSVYQGSVFYRWISSRSSFATVEGGIGLGQNRSYRSYRESEDATEIESAEETISGLSSRAVMRFWDTGFVGLEALFGKGSKVSSLIFKPISYLVIGGSF